MSDSTEVSKQQFIEQIGTLADQMIAMYDRDFAMGALLLAAGFIAQAQQVANEAAPTSEMAQSDPDREAVCAGSAA